MPKPQIMFYHDGRHPLIYQYEPPIHQQEYESAVDELLGTPVEAIMFGLGDGRTMLHDTKVGELWGHNVDGWPHLVFHRNATDMIGRGIDPLQIIWTARTPVDSSSTQHYWCNRVVWTAAKTHGVLTSGGTTMT